MAIVCHMTSAHKCNDGRIFLKECVSLAKAGHTVYLVAPADGSFEAQGVKTVAVPRPASRIKRMTLTANEVYRAAVGLNADIYHIHDPELLPAAHKLAKLGKQVIFDSHEFYRTQLTTKRYIPSCLRGLVSGLYGRYENRVCKLLSAVVIPSEPPGRNYFKEMGIPIVVVDNSPILPPHVDHNLEDPSRRSVCYMGSISYERGITHLVKAAHKASIPLVLCGPVSESYLSELKGMAEFENVTYAGVLPPDRLPEVLEGCFVGASTLLNVGQYWGMNGLPTKVPEYLANGLPVVVSASDYNVAFVDEVKCGIAVDPENIDQVAAALTYLNENRAEAQLMAQRGELDVRAHRGWNVEEEKLLALYQSIEQKLTA